MSTTIRPEIRNDNEWHISKHRYYELKHFCLQYGEWRGEDRKNRELVRHICDETDPCIGRYIFKAVTRGYSYAYLRTTLGMPCGRSMYYDRYRKFFWLLSKEKYECT